MEMENNPSNNNVLYGWILIASAIFIIGLAILIGASEVAGMFSLIAVIGLMIFEGIKLITYKNHNKMLHDRFNDMEKLIKRLKE